MPKNAGPEGYRELDLTHRAEIEAFLKADPPDASELTFTNLYIWRAWYRPFWRVAGDGLLMILAPEGRAPLGLPPVGGNKAEALAALTGDLLKIAPQAAIHRIDQTAVDQYVDPERFEILADRDNSDYVYLTEDLGKLAGRKFHKKKNHVNKFYKSNEFEFRPLSGETINLALDLQEDWCSMRACAADRSLNQEDLAVHQALIRAAELGWQGGAILMDGKVEAFSLGEELNPETTVCHVEKANPNIPGLYAVINQQCCLHAWPGRKYMNREQDMGRDGLRRAKESYHPDHLVEKFIITAR